MQAPTSWLFVKDGQSIYIVRPPDSYEMLVSGPGGAGGLHEFQDEKELQAFQIELAESLSGQGWLLWAFDRDRRTGVTERRAGTRPGASDRRRGHDHREAPTATR
jgi:hypothetical protein